MIFDPIKAAIAPYALAVKAGIALALLLAAFVGGCNRGQAGVQAKWDKETAKVKEAATRTLESLRRIDAANAREQAATALRFNDERNEIAADAAHWRGLYESGGVQVGSRFVCPATKAGTTGTAGASGEAGGYGLTQADAGFLVGFAGERDRIASERNEAVAGWQSCRRISETVP